MTKADIVERIYERAKASKKDASDVVDLVFELIKARLEAGEKVKLSGFGNFVVNAKRPRKGRNPQTGEEIIISGRRVLSFKASQVLKNAINDGLRPAENANGTAVGQSAPTIDHHPISR